MDNQEDILFTVTKSGVKKFLYKTFSFLYSYYIKFQINTTMIWTKLFNKEGRIRTLLESDALVLLFNTFLFTGVGNFFGGLIGQVSFILLFLNILLFLIGKLGWIEKLKD
jgi:hypothetical protein